MAGFKLLLLTHRFFPDIGGTETNALFLANAMHEAGADVTVVTWTKEAGDKQFPFKVVRHPGFFTLLRHHLTTGIVFENHLCLRLSWPRFFTGKPGIVALNTWVQTAGKSIGSRLRRWWLKRSKAVIAVSNAVRKKVWLPAIVIENAYNDSLFKRNEAVKKHKDFVFLGRLVSDKGAALMIDAFYAFYKLKNSFRDEVLSLTIIGDGPEKSLIQQKITSYKLGRYIQMTGGLTGIALVNALNEHKFMIVPSVWEEPYGIVALEGMACGCIPVVADSGGLSEAVGMAGLVFKKGDAGDLAEKMKMMINHTVLQNQLTNAAAIKLLNNTRNAVAQQYLNVFKRVINAE